MATIELNAGNLKSTVEENDIVIFDFWAPWCGPCKSFGPVFEAASETHGDIVFGKLNTEAQQEVAAQLQIRSIPTVMVFREGVQVYSRPGALPPPALEDLIQQVRALDMDEVRQKIAEETA